MTTRKKPWGGRFQEPTDRDVEAFTASIHFDRRFTAAKWFTPAFFSLLGLLPIMVFGGTGSLLARSVTAPMVGGMVSALVLTLLVLPAAYYLWRSRSLGKGANPQSE